MTRKDVKKGQFEQAFLESAFQYSMDDDLASTGRMLRSLKGLLVQTKVRTLLKQKSKKDAETYLAELEHYETHPLPGVRADIYTVCAWVGRGLDRVVVWKDGLPYGAVEYPAMLSAVREIEDSLNVMAGELCEILDVQLMFTGKKQFAWPEGPSEGGMRQRAG